MIYANSKMHTSMQDQMLLELHLLINSETNNFSGSLQSNNTSSCIIFSLIMALKVTKSSTNISCIQSWFIAQLADVQVSLNAHQFCPVTNKCCLTLSVI